MSIKIRIESTPKGDNPEWVRQAWIGLELMALGPAEVSQPRTGICGGLPPPAISLFRVPAKPAFDLLKQEQPEAYAWFVRMCPGFRNWNSLGFDEQCAVVVD